MTKGLLVFVYRHGKDCTNGGISSKYNQLILIGDEMPRIFTPDDKIPALMLAHNTFNNYYAIPAEGKDPNKVGWMWGGNFVYSSDSRFNDICPYPIPVHDRQDTPEDWERLTR